MGRQEPSLTIESGGELGRLMLDVVAMAGRFQARPDEGTCDDVRQRR
jgi:hypothetical protein